MKQFQPSPDQLDQARPLFNAHQTARSLMESQTPAAIGTSRLFSYMNGAQDDALERVLSQNLNVYRAYKSLLQIKAMRHIPQAIAASSTVYPNRELEGCSVRLQEARADSEDLYLIIEFQNRTAPLPTQLHLSLNDTQSARILLPAGRNGIIQTILTKSSQAAHLFQNPKTELFLT